MRLRHPRDARLTARGRNESALFEVTFSNHTLLSEDTVRWIAALGEHGLTDSQCVTLAMLRG